MLNFFFLEINQAFLSAAHKILLNSEEMKIDKFYFGSLDNSTASTHGTVLEELFP